MQCLAQLSDPACQFHRGLEHIKVDYEADLHTVQSRTTFIKDKIRTHPTHPLGDEVAALDTRASLETVAMRMTETREAVCSVVKGASKLEQETRNCISALTAYENVRIS